MRVLHFFAILLALLLPVSAFALPIDTRPFPAAEEQARIDRLQLAPWAGDGTERLIHAFDVDAEGRIALAFDWEAGARRARVGVYDRDGAFLWGFTYASSQANPVMWNGDGTLALLFVEHACLIGEGPVCTEVCKYVSGPAGTQLLNDRRKPARILGNERFELRMTSPLGTGYSSLVRVGADGQTTMLYDAPSLGIGASVLVVGVLAAVAAVLMVVLKRRRNS